MTFTGSKLIEKIKWDERNSLQLKSELGKKVSEMFTYSLTNGFNQKVYDIKEGSQIILNGTLEFMDFKSEKKFILPLQKYKIAKEMEFYLKHSQRKPPSCFEFSQQLQQTGQSILCFMKNKNKYMNSLTDRMDLLPIPVLLKLSEKSPKRSLQRHNYMFEHITTCSYFNQKIESGFLVTNDENSSIIKIRKAAKLECKKPGYCFSEYSLLNRKGKHVEVIKFLTDDSRDCILRRNMSNLSIQNKEGVIIAEESSISENCRLYAMFDKEAQIYPFKNNLPKLYLSLKQKEQILSNNGSLEIIPFKIDTGSELKNYYGETMFGMMHGQGKLMRENGDLYHGVWEYGKLVGPWKIEFSDGTFQEGTGSLKLI